MGNKTIDISKAPPLESEEIDISKAPSFDGEKKNSSNESPTSLTASPIPSAETVPTINGGGNGNDKPYNYSFGEINTPIEQQQLSAASTYGTSTEGRPQVELPKTIAEIKKEGGKPTFKNYLSSAGQASGEYIGKHLQQTLEGAKELGQGLKHGGVEGALDAIKGGANAAFGAASFTPVGAAFNVSTDAVVPESVNKWLFSPANKIAEEAGYKPKEGSLGEKALQTGDIVLSLLAMHKAGKLTGKAIGEGDLSIPPETINEAASDALKSKIENKEPLNVDEAKQVTDIVNSATPQDLKQALSDNSDKLHPEHHFENKVVNVIEKSKEDKDVIKDIAKLEGVDKSTFENVVNTAKQADHITDDQVKELTKSFEDVQSAKELIPEEHKNNAKVVSLMVDKNELLNAKKSTDKVFHEPIDKQIEVIDGKIKTALGLPKEEKVVAKEENPQEETVKKEVSPIETKPSPEDNYVKDIHKKAMDEFSKAGLNVIRGSISETDYGTSAYFYVERPDGTTQKIRVSDHSVENKDRINNEIHIGGENRIQQAIKNTKDKIREYSETEKIKDKLWNKDKERTSNADKKWDELKSSFQDQDFAKNERTYQTLKEFKKKVPNAKNIVQTPLSGGAFSYEYSFDRNKNTIGNKKPSINYIENIELPSNIKEHNVKREEFVNKHVSDLENSGEMSKDISKEQYSNYFRNLYDRKYVNKTSNESTARTTANTGAETPTEPTNTKVGEPAGQGVLAESSPGSGGGGSENPPTEPTTGEPERIKVTHAAIEERRKEAGLPPIEKLPTDIKKDFTEAAGEFKDTHKDLAQKIANSDKTLINRKDTYVLGLGRVKMLKEAKEIREKIKESADSNDIAKVDELKGDLKTVEDNLDVNETAIKHASSEAGKALQSFQTAFAEDLSLENTLLKARSIAKEGKLTDEQVQKFTEISSRLEEAQKKLSEHQDKIAKMESQKAIDDLAAEEKLKKGIDESVAKKKFTIKAKAVADEFRKLKTNPPTFTDSNGNPIQVFTAGITWNDIIEVGAKAIEKTGEIADGVKDMVDHVKEQEWYTKLSDKDKEAFEGQLKGHFESINQPKEEGKTSGIASSVKELIRQGITKESEIVSKLKEDNPEMTERQIRDEISGYGRSTKLNQDPIEMKYREIKRVSGLISKLEDVESGKPPVKKITGQSERTQNEIDLRNQINEGMQKLTGEKEKKVVTDEDRWKTNLERYKTRLKNELTSLEQKREVRDYEIKKRVVTPLDKEGEELKMKVNKEKVLRQVELIKIELENRSILQKVLDNSIEAANIPRTSMSSMDFSAPLRQGLIATVAHPKLAVQAGKEMFKMAGSQERFDKWFQNIKEDPRYTEAKKSGLYIADPHDLRLSAKEESFMNNLVQKIPFIGTHLIKGSERAYTGYLNKLRWDLYNQLSEQLFVNGENYINHPKLYKGLADFVNNSTGRGKLGWFEKAAPLLNTGIFSPRLIASRVRALGITDIATGFTNGYYSNLPKPVRIQALKDMGKLLVVGGTVMALAKLNGAKVESDPRSSDYGKIRVGNTRWDIWGGHQQYIRVLAQILSGKTKSNGKIYELGNNKAFGRTRADVAGDFVRGKLAPVPSMAWDVLKGRTIIGEPVTLKDEAMSHLLPLIYSDLSDAMKDQGAKALFTVGLPSTFGVGVSTYSPKKKMAKYKLQTSQ